MKIPNEILLAINIYAAMASAGLAVIIGVSIRELGLRMYVLVLISAILTAGAVVETWFLDSTLFKSSAIGWAIGYVADDVLLNLNALMPEFIKEIINKVLDNLKKFITKKTDIDNDWK